MEIIKCKECDKEFGSREALSSHNSAKHNIFTKDKEERKFKIKKKYIIFAFIIALLVFSVYSAYKKQSAPGEYDEFAKCLSKNNAIMYGTQWCTHCKAQKALFGKSFNYVTYIDCDKSSDICNANGIKGYPTWIINNQSYSGSQPLETLSKLTKCELSK